jgi:hypothetical protein
MSTPTRKISEIATQADALTATDRVEITQAMSTTPVTRYATPGQITDFVETDISTLPNGLVTNAMVNASAAIAKSKLAALEIVNADVAANAAIAKSKLASLAIVNSDVATNAAIAKSKLAALDIVNADVATNAAIAKSKLAALDIVNADVAASAGIVDTKLATISTAGKVSNSATTATNNNTASAIVARDANGDFSARDASLRQVILRGDTSGTATVKVPAVAGTPTFTLPSGVGSNKQFLQTNGAGVMAWASAASWASYSCTTDPALTVDANNVVPLNTEDFDPDGIGSVSANRVTLQAGTYYAIMQVALLWPNTAGECRLQAFAFNATNGQFIPNFGTMDWASTTPPQGTMVVCTHGLFTLDSAKEIEFRVTPFRTGSGSPFLIASNKQTRLTFIKVA